MTIPRSTNQCGLLERTETVQTTIILHMGGEAFLAEVKLTGDLRICAFRKLPAEVDIDEIEPRAPLVGLELLNGEGHLLTASLFV